MASLRELALTIDAEHESSVSANAMSGNLRKSSLFSGAVVNSGVSSSRRIHSAADRVASRTRDWYRKRCDFDTLQAMVFSRRSHLWRAALWIPPIAYAAVIFYFSSESDPLPSLRAAVWDKVLHATEYAGLALLLCRAWRGEGCRWLTACALAVTVACFYAVTDEWHQGLVPGRDTDVHDWLADTVGGSIGSVLYPAVAALGARFNVFQA